MKQVKKKPKPSRFAKEVGKALRRAGKEARRVAKMHGTPIYYSQDGKIVAAKP